MESALVIKVQCGKTLRRFNARVDENDKLDLDMLGLKTKIFSLFDLPPDADITMTYVDEDDDIIALVDDDDLKDVMRQRLKFLKIFVVLNTEKSSKSYARSSGNSTPSMSPCVEQPLINVNAIVAEALKSVPEPLCEGLSKIPLDVASKAASSSPAIAELIESFAKLGQSFMTSAFQPQDSASDCSVTSPVCKELDASKEDVLQDACGSNPAPKGLSSGDTQVKKRGKAVLDLNVDASRDLMQQSDKRKVRVEKEAKEEKTGDATKRKVKVEKELKKENTGATNFAASSGNQSGSSSADATVTGNYSECPFGGLPVMGGPTAFPSQYGWFHSHKRNCNRPDALGGIFHRGVRCDGCGVHPITGPRFKSKVKEDYDLCSICFAEMGNDADYDRIDRPISFRAAKFLKGFEQHPWAPITTPPPPVMPPRMCQIKSHKPKLESRFISDVTVMDGTAMAPSTAFTKIWRMRNNGSLVWPRGVQLVWIGGDKFSNDLSVPLEVPVEGVAVHAELDIAVDFTAPGLPGRYISYWRMASPSGQKFGQRVWVLIQVDASLNENGNNSQGLNLNLPPENHVPRSSEVIDMNVQPSGAADFFGPSYVNANAEGEKPVVDEQYKKDQDINFPINDALLVGQGSSSAPPVEILSSVLYPIIDPPSAVPIVSSHAEPPLSAPNADQVANAVFSESANKSGISELTQDVPIPHPKAPSSVSYPVIHKSLPISVHSHAKDLTSSATVLPVEVVSASPSSAPSPVVPAAAWSGSTGKATESVEKADFEMNLLKELEAMGFKQVDLNKEILRSNGYNLEQSVDDLCGVSEWDPMLEELQEMGFLDKEMNKRLLKKNNGSIKRVVMDLLSGEKA